MDVKKKAKPKRGNQKKKKKKKNLSGVTNIPLLIYFLYTNTQTYTQT